MKRIKILYHHRTGSKDGQAVHIEELVAALRNLGHDVTMVEPPEASGASFGTRPGLLAWMRKHLPKAAYELLELAYNVPAYIRLRRAFAAHKPDVLYERHNLYLLAGAMLRKRFGVPYLLEVNSPLYLERGADGGLALGTIAHAAERWVWRRADCVLPVTTVLARIVEREGVASDKIVVIPNGVDPNRFATQLQIDEAKRRLGIANKLVFGFTGFVREWNALGSVIDYLANAGRTDWILLVVGDGPARANLEARAHSLGVGDRVRFTGVVGRDRICDHVCAFDIALQPAANEYASPLKLFEYMALGRAIVAPRQPNILEILTDGTNGILFEPRSRESLFEALDRLVSDPELRARLGRAAQCSVADRELTWTANAEKVAALARRLTDRSDDGRQTSGIPVRLDPVGSTLNPERRENSE
jgi:glycosyltransferase involved in cell wall biosynthesis